MTHELLPGTEPALAAHDLDDELWMPTITRPSADPTSRPGSTSDSSAPLNPPAPLTDEPPAADPEKRSTAPEPASRSDRRDRAATAVLLVLIALAVMSMIAVILATIFVLPDYLEGSDMFNDLRDQTSTQPQN